MRFLLRAAFWLGVIAVLLPRSEPAPASSAQIRASDAVSAASATIGDVTKFCDRQPEACTVGSQAAEVIEDRAKAGAKRLYDMLNNRLAANDDDRVTATASPRTAKSVPLPTARPIVRNAETTLRNAPQDVSPAAASQDTLTPADTTPIWRGPLPRKDPRERPA